ncbi:MAG: GDP-mannose 4,6-dehydratase [Candidatus Staskawiczbacteria bacterium]|jgi:CDP-glucose 4,6-dehydratase
MKTNNFKKVLVTGGAGFIGSYLVNELVRKNYEVVVIDDLSSGKKESLNSRVKFYKQDVRSKDVFKIFKKENPQIIFHLAAKPIVEEVYKNPYEAIEVNVMGTVNILEACRKQGGVESIVIVSSDKAYGKAEKLPYKETSPLRGDHPYDVSKSAADLIARTYFVTYGLPILITRFSNVFGPGDTNFSRIIPGILESIIENKEFLIRSDGKMIREYTYVKDIVDGCIKLSNHKKNFGEAFNFGSKNIFNVIEVIKNIEKILNVRVNYKILNIAKNEIPVQYLDWSKSKKVLNWEPENSFRESIKETFNWYKNEL